MNASRLLAAFLVLVGLSLAPGYVDNVDSRIIVRTAERLVDDGTWALDEVRGAYMTSPEYGVRAPDGSFQMKFGPGNALAAIPFVVAGRAVLGAAGLDPGRAGEAGASVASALWFAAAGVLVFLIARRTAGVRGGVLVALLYSLTTYAIVYGKSSYLETPLSAAVLLAFHAALRLRDRPDSRGTAALLGVACGAVLWLKLAACLVLVGLLPILVTAGFRRGTKAMAVAAGIFCVFVAALCALNAARFGNPFATGYESSLRFAGSFWDGAVRLVASGRGGLFVYSPLLVLALPGTARLARRDGALAIGVWLSFAASLALHARFFSPFGGDAWGPRYLLPNAALLALPAGIAVHGWLGADAVRRTAASAVVAFSAAVQVPPAFVSFHEVYGLRSRAGATAVEEAGSQRLTARILVAKLRGGRDAYDLADLGLGAGRHETGRAERGWNLWPERVAQDRPGRGAVAWTAWCAIVAAGAAVGVRLARSSREDEP